MHHGVDAGRNGDMRRQPQSQFRIENRPIRNQARRYHALFFRGWRRDDGDRGHLRTRTSRRRYQNQRKTLALGEADAINVIEMIGQFREIRDEFCRIQRAATTN